MHHRCTKYPFEGHKICTKFFNSNHSLGRISGNLILPIYYEWLANKLNDPNTSAKACWSTIKTRFNGKKVPVIPPILVNNKLETNFKDKASIFNDFFSKQCQPIPNNSTLPSTIDTDLKKILKLTQVLNFNKGHEHDVISVRMLKISGIKE